MDFAAGWPPMWSAAGTNDDDGVDGMIQRLCVEAGCIMEDLTLGAISRLPDQRDERHRSIGELKAATAEIAALINAAVALDRVQQRNQSLGE